MSIIHKVKNNFVAISVFILICLSGCTKTSKVTGLDTPVEICEQLILSININDLSPLHTFITSYEKDNYAKMLDFYFSNLHLQNKLHELLVQKFGVAYQTKIVEALQDIMPGGEYHLFKIDEMKFFCVKNGGFREVIGYKQLMACQDFMISLQLKGLYVTNERFNFQKNKNGKWFLDLVVKYTDSQVSFQIKKLEQDNKWISMLIQEMPNINTADDYINTWQNIIMRN